MGIGTLSEFCKYYNQEHGHLVLSMERHHPQNWPIFRKYILKNLKKWVENGTFALKVYTFS